MAMYDQSLMLIRADERADKARRERDAAREALVGLLDAARPYLDKAAPHEQLFSGEDLRNFDRLASAVAQAKAALES